MEGTKLGHQISGVLCCIHSQCLGDDKEGPGELGNSQLLSGTLNNKKKKNTMMSTLFTTQLCRHPGGCSRDSAALTMLVA